MPPDMLGRVVCQVLLDRPPNSPLSPCSAQQSSVSVSTESPGRQRPNAATSQPGGALEALSNSVGQFTTASDRENTCGRSAKQLCTHTTTPLIFSTGLLGIPDQASGCLRVAWHLWSVNGVSAQWSVDQLTRQATTLSQTDRSKHTHNVLPNL